MGTAAAALLWLTLYVHGVFAGNWTGLFLHGKDFPLPPDFPSVSKTYFIDGPGYDGQFYRLIAHDPWLSKGYAASIDAPRIRYRRILVPALAWALALGNPAWIEVTYVAVQLGFLGLGVWWLGNFAILSGRSWRWGLAFAAMPVTILSLHRNLLDLPMAALCVGFAYYAREGAPRFLFPVLTAVALCRETGLLLTAAYAFYCLLHGRWARAMGQTASALPVIAWTAFLSRQTEDHGIQFLSVPFSGLAARFLQAKPYNLSPPMELAVQAADSIALVGVVLAVAVACNLAWRLRDPSALAAGAFAALAAAISYPDAWSDLYAFGRWLAPLFLFTAMAAIERRRWVYFLPTLALMPRLAMEFARPVLDVARWLAH
ncbi:MAG: hypothetical protein SFV18_01735 [Bryobacteraceae bacterium]|nr:hypothetical protein [Bryobacteraceae bacterium]